MTECYEYRIYWSAMPEGARCISRGEHIQAGRDMDEAKETFQDRYRDASIDDIQLIPEPEPKLYFGRSWREDNTDD